MTKDTCRRIGAVAGLAIGILAMYGLGYSGVIPGALFGAGGCVLGAVVAEHAHGVWNRGKGR